MITIGVRTRKILFHKFLLGIDSLFILAFFISFLLLLLFIQLTASMTVRIKSNISINPKKSPNISSSNSRLSPFMILILSIYL